MTQPPAADVKELFHGRAKADYSQSAELLKSGVQFVFAANGGAALAVLPCLTAIVTATNLNPAIAVSVMLPKFTVAVAIYLTGVLLAAAALAAFSVSRESWGHFWEDNAATGEVNFENPFAVQGSRYSTIGRVLLLLSAIGFVCGSGVAVTAFLP